MLKRVLTLILAVTMAIPAFAGGTTCVIIIQCGSLRAKADALHEYPATTVLKARTAELSTLEGEICDGASEFLQYATPAERDEIVRRAAGAWEFGVKLQRFMDAWDQKSERDQKKLADDIGAFADEQRQFFQTLADRHKNENSTTTR